MAKTDFYREIRKNNIKTYFLFLLFFIIIILVGYALQYLFSYGGFGILTIAGIFAIVFSLVGYYSGDKIVLKSSGAKKADKRKYLHLHNVVEGLAIASGLPKPEVYVINDPAPNAFATGRDPEHSSVAVTTGLLELLNREELEGVIAHELSHIRNRDIKVMTIVSVLFGIISIVSDIALRSLIFGGGNRENNNGLIMIIAIIFIILAPIVGMFIQMSMSRKREYLADASGAEITRYPKGLANALRKISSKNRPVKNASKSTAHFYISNPLKKRNISKLLSTHPPIDDRIKRLEAM